RPGSGANGRPSEGVLMNELIGSKRTVHMINIINANHNAPAPCLGLPPLDGSLQRFNDRGVLSFARGKRLAAVGQIAQVPAAAADAGLHRLNDLQTLLGVASLSVRKIG